MNIDRVAEAAQTALEDMEVEFDRHYSGEAAYTPGEAAEWVVNRMQEILAALPTTPEEVVMMHFEPSGPSGQFY